MIRSSFYLFIFSLLLVSCRNEEGEGGSSTVEGYVYKIIHSDNNYSLQIDTVPATKEDIFIVYGDANFYGDDLKSDASGFYKFNYLTDGNYTLFAYNNKGDGTKEAVSVAVNVKHGKTARADTLYIHTGDAYGLSIIKGVINVNYYKKGTYESTEAGVGQRVLICRTGEDIPFDDVRAGLNGTFGFEKLVPGSYDIFVISQNPDTEVESVIKQTILIEEPNTIYALPLTFTVNVAV